MIKNLIFDFGGVLYEIKPELTLKNFQKMTTNIDLFNNSIEEKKYLNTIRNFEKGKFSAPEFRKTLKQQFALKCNNKDFDKAWNSLLIKQNQFSLQLITQLKDKFNLYLLSNTNSIHYNHFLPQCRKLFSLFEKCFFSFKIGYVKPEAEIFEYVLSKTKIYADETLFIDDSEINIKSAIELGFQTFLVKNSNTEKILDLL